MSRLIYIVPWAICDTENIYVKKEEQNGPLELKEGNSVDDWTVKQVIPSPDKRTKDIYIELDVYCGYDFKRRSRDVSIVKLNNSMMHLSELGYVQASEQERSFLRKKVLKLER